jgi:hypothetical protein
MVRMPDDPVEAVRTVVRLAARAQREGLPSLREEAEHADSEMLRDGLRLIAEDRPEAEVKAALGRQITEAEARGATNVPVRRMTEAGLLSIRAGAGPREVREMLAALLTPEERARLEGTDGGPGAEDEGADTEWLPYAQLPAPVQQNLTAEQWLVAQHLVVAEGRPVPEATQYLYLKSGQFRQYRQDEPAEGPLLAAHNLAGGRGQDSGQLRSAPPGAHPGT